MEDLDDTLDDEFRAEEAEMSNMMDKSETKKSKKKGMKKDDEMQ